MTASSSTPHSPVQTLDLHLQQAVKHHQAGNLQGAETLYRTILKSQPNHPDANHNMGVLAIQVKQINASLPFFKTALTSQPESALYWISYIDALIQSQDTNTAQQLLRLAIQQGVRGEAIDKLAERLATPVAQPAQAPPTAPPTAPAPPTAAPDNNASKPIQAKSGKGGAPNPRDLNKLADLCNRGKFAEAEAAAKAITSRYPNHGAAWKSLGIILYQQQRFEAALEAMQIATQLLPTDAESHGNLGIILLDLHQSKNAEASLRKAVNLKPNWADARNNIGIALRELGRMKESEEQLQRAIAIKPNFADAHMNLGITQHQLMRIGDAEDSIRRALAIKPNSAKIHNNLGLNLVEQNRYLEAEACMYRALELQPDFIDASTNLGRVLQEQGKLEEAEASLRNALRLSPRSAISHSNLLFCLNYHPDKSAEEIYSTYQDFNTHLGLPHQAQWRAHNNSRDTNRRLKVGYVSPDFRKHSARHFLEPLLSNHDKSVLELYAYAELHVEDEQTAQYKTLMDHWVPTVGMTDTELAERIRADGIDILVDQAGHTANNRLGVFALKPAPVSVSWLGYGYTTGLTAIDYYMLDEVSAPIGCDHLFSEQPWRLKSPGYVFRPAKDIGAVSALPALKNGYVTFGTLSRAIRINYRTIRVWSAILKRVKHSKLIINSSNFKTVDMQDQLAKKFAAHGIGREQLDIGFESPPWDLMRRIDIAFDCFPHNSGTTLIEHLCMGLPYVTLANRPSVGLIGSSILTGAGHPEWIAKTEEEYTDIAVALASDLPKLAEIRANLRTEMVSGPLMDEPGFARKIEAAYREMFSIWSMKNQ